MPSLRTLLSRLQIRLAVRMINRAQSLRDIQRFALRRHAQQLALVTPTVRLSYRDLDDRTLRLAAAWRKHGVTKGARVMTLLSDEWQQVVLRFAAIETGVGLITFNAAHSSAMILAAAEHLRPALIVIGSDLDRPEFAVLRAKLGVERVWTAGPNGDLETAMAATSPSASRQPVSRDDVLTFGFTSGTTGPPKLLAMNHAPFLHSLRLLLLNFTDPPQGRSRALVGIPLIGAGSGLILPTMLGGGILILPRAYTAEALIDVLRAERPTHVFTTPSLLIDLLDHPDLHAGDMVSVRQYIYGSASMPVAKLREAIARFGMIFQQGYAMAEAMPPIAMLPPRDHVDDGLAPELSALSSSGHVAQGVAVQIRDERGSAVLPACTRGRIWVRTPTVFEGYPDQPELNREVLREGWYFTGDYGYFDASGRVHVLDRRQNLIERPEGRIYPRLVEERAHECAHVKEAALVEVRNRTCLCVSRRRRSRSLDASAIERELRAHLAATLPAWQQPERVVVMDELPRSFLAKLLHREVRALLEAGAAEGGA